MNQLFEATGELGQNVVEHAGSPVGGFVAAQRYKAGAPDERIIVAVGEVGRGQGLDGILWIRSGSASRTITRQRAVTTGVSSLQGTIVGARLPCRPGR